MLAFSSAATILGQMTSYSAGQPPEAPPLGVYLWYSEGGVPTNLDCRNLIERVSPSRKKAEDWLWGRIPDGSARMVEFYLFLSADRMEPTFSAEGDYDSGSIRYTQTTDGLTGFTLVPDDHPDVTVDGSILAPANDLAVAVTLKGIPTTSGRGERTTHYCRFTEGDSEA